MVGLFSRFARKIFNLRREKIRVAFVEYSGAKEYLETLQSHICAPQAGNTRAPACVSPGRNPGGNTRRSGVHRASRVVFLSLCSRILSQSTIFFLLRPKLKIFGEKTHFCRVVFLDTYVLGDLTKIQKFTYKKKENKNFKKKNAFFHSFFALKHTRNS